jgi:hypothetical protein
MFKWLEAREATEVEAVLADDFVLQSASDSSGKRGKDGRPRPRNQDLQRFLQKFLQRVDLETGPLKLNVFKRAKLANSQVAAARKGARARAGR